MAPRKLPVVVLVLDAYVSLLFSHPPGIALVLAVFFSFTILAEPQQMRQELDL